MLRKLKNIYREQYFFPGFFGLFINPFYFARRGINKGVSRMATYLSGSLLDVGCGTKPYRRLFQVDSYRGLDIDSSATRKIAIADDLYDGKDFPYQNEVFDSVLCNQVLEHVFYPNDFLQEINRVMKSRGKLLLTVPFVWDEHEQPYDYARYTSFGLRDLLEKNGFQVIRYEKLGADATTIFQLTNAYLFKATQRWPRLPNFIFTVTIMASINFFGLLAGKLLPNNPDLFLDHIVLAEKVS